MSCCTMPMGCSHDGCGRADERNDSECCGRAIKERVAARDHVDACGHHGCGVDECRDRSGTFHGVWQPDVQRDLRAFTSSTDYEK